MTKDISKQSKDMWPLPKFHYQLKCGTAVVSFQEASGLAMENRPIECRHGDDPVLSRIRMPGMKKFGNVTIKRGVFKCGIKFWDWFSQIKMSTNKCGPVTISLLDEKGMPTMVWTLTNAFPTKITDLYLTADANEVVFETIEIAHEGLTMANV